MSTNLLFERYNSAKETWTDKQIIYFSNEGDKMEDEWEHGWKDGEYYGGIPCEYFFTVRDGKDDIKVRNGEEVVLDTSYIRIAFQYPPTEKVIFRIEATDISKGFTRKELAYKILQHFHMLRSVGKNYNMEKGEFDMNNENNKSNPFRAILSWEYDDNGISFLEYNKNEDVWNVEYRYYL